LAGFVPVCPSVLVNYLVGHAALERHFCVLDDETGGVREFAGALLRVAAASARRHVVVRFRRLRSGRGAINLDPLSVRSLVGMVFVERDAGPTEQELFEAARLSEGRPGAFLAQLRAAARMSFAPNSVVHEAPQEYVVLAEESPVGSTEQSKGRTLESALRAIERARVLAGRGRHAAADRLLSRGSRVLSGRGRKEEAAMCLVQAGSLALNRGRAADAARLFEEARALSISGPAALDAAVGLGEAWIADLRLVEGEAVLRGTLAAADALPDHNARVAATAMLVRCLNGQERSSEAIAVAAALEWRDEDRDAVNLLAGLVRSHCVLGRTAAAIRLARRAEALAHAAPDQAARITAGLAVAEALAWAGDTTGMAEALRGTCDHARSAHLPLAIITARLLECEQPSTDPSRRDRCARRLRALQRLKLPRSYRTRVDAAIAALGKSDSVVTPPLYRGPDLRAEAADALEALLHACHAAADDRTAVSAICMAARERLRGSTVMLVAREDRRVLAMEGRAWASPPAIVAHAFAAGQPCASDAGIEPREAAEPVRHGNEVIAAVACRWSAGTAADMTAASAVLRAAALAAATPVRALLDSAPPAAPAGAWGDLLGNSPAALTLRDDVTRAARAPFPVLIEGESGCGKELVARAIHRLSVRRERRFCAVNCAALTDELVEAELFGHARGAFTGAATERAGLFEEADGGTLFLDEVAELSARAQAKLLRVLQEGEVRRVGENFSRRVDVRIVAATNRKLGEEVPAGRFRADLRFRLDVVRIAVPPLRERPGDLPVLAVHFWTDASQRVGSRATLTGDTLAALARYDWPGNVRELQNVIAWIAVHSPRRGRIGPSALPAHVAQSAAPTARSFAAAREEFERRFVRAALAGADGQMSRAARALGVSRQGLSKMMRRLHIEAPVRDGTSLRP
jgi:DNA-binding NtrC family response regulator